MTYPTLPCLYRPPVILAAGRHAVRTH